MTPITRIEHYLAKMNGEDVQIPVPITRKELYLAKICGEDVEVPEPVTIDEKFLYALAGGEVNLPKPVTRLQNIMAKRLGLQAAEIEPITRQEYFWHGGDEPEPPTPEVWKTASGAIASFVTSVAYPLKSLVAQINPVQDLHGYENPWPAGGGKNKLEVVPFSVGEMNGITFTYNSDGSVTVNGTATARAYKYLRTYSAGWFPVGTTYTFRLAGVPSTASAAFLNFSYSDNGMTYAGSYETLTYEGTKTITSAHQYNSVLLDIPAGQSFNNNKIYVNAEVGTTASAWTPYSNICPISGWQGLSGQRTGANVFDQDTYFPSKGFTQQEDGSWYTNNLSPLLNATVWENTKGVAGSFGITYQSKNLNSSGSSGLRIYFVYEDGYIGRNYPNPTTEYQKLEYTTDSNRTLSKICWDFGSTANFTWIKDFSIALGTDTSYHAYTGEAISVSWQDEAGTVYGGTLDVVSGLLTVDRAEHTVSANDVAELFQTGTNANRVGIKVSDSQLSPTNTERLKIISNIAKADTSILTASAQKVGDCCMYSGGAMTYSVALFGVPTSATTAADARSWLVEQGCTFVYYLATPVTYQLTPQQVSTLLGQNNVWHDANGDVEVEYLESGLPEAYTQVAGFTFNSDCYFEISGLKLRGSDTVQFSMIPRVACNVFGCYTTSDADNNYSLYVSTANNAKYLRYDGSTYKSKFASGDLGQRYNISITPTGSHGFPEGQDDTWTEATFEASTDMCIGTTATNASSAKFKGDIIGTFTVAGRFSGVPCKRNSDNVLGYYDMVSKKFYEPALGTPTVAT